MTGRRTRWLRAGWALCLDLDAGYKERVQLGEIFETAYLRLCTLNCVFILYICYISVKIC